MIYYIMNILNNKLLSWGVEDVILILSNILSAMPLLARNLAVEILFIVLFGSATCCISVGGSP
jgi:hypothetical protein